MPMPYHSAGNHNMVLKMATELHYRINKTKKGYYENQKTIPKWKGSLSK
jgi:hypothetical protein